MTGKGVRGLSEAMRALSVSPGAVRTRPSLPTRIIPMVSHSRTMATEAALPETSSSTSQPITPLWTPTQNVPLTIHAFPTLEPLALESWSTKHLHLPLRRDILHQAVVFEGSNTRQGTAQAKTRWEVRGSSRKVRPQKGMGRSRLGDKKSPMLRGGGKSHGPRARDFGLEMPRKMYDLAWRTALSWRYRRGELIVCEDGMELPLPEEFLQLAAAGSMGRELEDGYVKRYAESYLRGLEWGKGNGRTTFITGDRRPNLYTSLEVAGADGRALEVDDVDVKDLLETGRIVIERDALRYLVQSHQSDLISRIWINGVRQIGPGLGKVSLASGQATTN